jgi:septum formation protein
MSEDVWILASNSPRRRELLGLFQHPFVIKPADINEDLLADEKPWDYVKRLAVTKALKGAQLNPLAALIIAADTTVADGSEILGKPVDEADAVRMLTQLRSRTHQVYTAISLIQPSENRQMTTLCRTSVPMRDYSDAEIERYIASGDPFDKAGAYAIQNSDFHPVENFTGCFASVMGFPLCHLARTLQAMQIETHLYNAEDCQRHLGYECPIFQAVLDGAQIG